MIKKTHINFIQKVLEPRRGKGGYLSVQGWCRYVAGPSQQTV